MVLDVRTDNEPTKILAIIEWIIALGSLDFEGRFGQAGHPLAYRLYLIHRVLSLAEDFLDPQIRKIISRIPIQYCYISTFD